MNGSAKRSIGPKACTYHRWLGITLVAFVVLLSTTGIALNHSEGWRLAELRLNWPWLLHWYGMDVPSVSAAYPAGGSTVALLGQALYLDANEIATGIVDVVGAVQSGAVVAIATPDELILATEDGELIERIDMTVYLPSGIDALGRFEDTLVYRSGREVLESDLDVLALTPSSPETADVAIWSVESEMSPARLESLARTYRGDGITVQQLLLDLHSGRMFARAGRLLMDIVGLLLVALSASGLILWLRARRRR